MTAVKTLLVLRHGQTGHNASGIYQGHTDTELSSLGREQAIRAAHALSAWTPQRVVCSDLRRAQATAQSVSAVCRGVVELEPALREIDVGAWAGLSHREVAERYPDEVQAMGTGADVRRGEYGETAAEVATRTAAVATRTIAEIEVGQSAVLVGHGFASRVMTANLLGWSTEQARSDLTLLDNCHWGELAWSSHGWAMVGWNLTYATAAAR